MPEPLPAEWMEQGPRCLNDFNALNCKVIREQNPGIFRQALALYHGSVRFMDDQIARIIAFLEARDLARNTLVVFTTDHGDMMGDHGCMAKGAPHYDGCIRAPLIAWGHGVRTGVSDRLTCALDFFPTFCEAAGIEGTALPPLEGMSFAPACRGTADAGWPEVAVWYGSSQSVITDDGWRLTRYTEAGEGQMFDLGHDPDEQHNLYGEPAHAAKRQELLERLVKVTARPFRIPRYRNLAQRTVDFPGNHAT
jgi:arylsulfatase A-like enzyme